MAEPAHDLGQYGRLVEHYEMPWLIERIQDALERDGALTVAGYQEALVAARNDAGKEPQG